MATLTVAAASRCWVAGTGGATGRGAAAAAVEVEGTGGTGGRTVAAPAADGARSQVPALAGATAAAVSD